MAVGITTTRNTTVSLNGNTTGSTSVAKTAGSRIVGVHRGPGTSPEVLITGIQFADATGQAVNVSYRTLGPSSSASYSLVLAISEVADA